jgi:hypothetical protein
MNANIVLVDNSKGAVPRHELETAASALQHQITNQLALPPPYGWGFNATLSLGVPGHAPKPNDWVLELREHPDQPGALGDHGITPSGQPYMNVFPLLDKQDGLPWVPTASHEVAEAGADPMGRRAAQSWDGFFWALEIADAVEADMYPVMIGPDKVFLSNFVLPPYFEPVQNMGGLKQDAMGLLRSDKRLEIRPGGYGQKWVPGRGWVQLVHREAAPRAFRQSYLGRRSRRQLMSSPIANAVLSSGPLWSFDDNTVEKPGDEEQF